MNTPIEPTFPYLQYSMEYLMHHTYKSNMYPKKKSYKAHECPHQCYFKAGDSEMNKNQEYSNFLHTYCDTDHIRYLSIRGSVTSIVHVFNVTLVSWCAKKNLRPLKRFQLINMRNVHKGIISKLYQKTF